MLSPEQIKNVVFSNYDYFIKYAKNNYSYIKRNGLDIEELVNEAIVNIFDVKTPFLDNESILSFVKTAIKSGYFIEKESLKDNNFIIRNNRNGEEYSIPDKPIHINVPSEEFIKIYSIFELHRFGNNLERKACNKCGAIKFKEYSTGKGLKMRCLSCRYWMSITAQTYICNMKLSYSIFYKLVTVISQNENVTSVKLGKLIGITQATAWKRKRLIISTILNVNSKKRDILMDKILNLKIYDDQPIELIKTGMKKFTPDDIREIRRLKNNQIYRAKEIAEMFLTDSSTINKIAKGIIYYNY